MRVFVAALLHETSSYSPIPTSRASFETFEYHRPSGGRVDEHARALAGYGAFVNAALANGDSVYASTYANAQPSGPASRAAYESLRDEIVVDLQRAGPVDLVLLFLHGAQMADGYDDCEGDLLERVRAVVGPDTFVGALLDLHANVSSRMMRMATVLSACLLYPHDDFDARARHLYEVGIAIRSGRVRPRLHYRFVPMVGMFYTTEPRMAAVVSAAEALQRTPGVLSVSLIHGFPYTDSPHLGAGVLIYTDAARPDAERELGELAAAFFAARDESKSLRISVDEALERVEAAPPDADGRPFVIADACDNPGGGAGSDATFLLEAVLQKQLRGYAFALFWDPVVAQFAADAGQGARFRARLGGKTGPFAHRPLDVDVHVRSVREDALLRGLGFVVPLGVAAALEVAGNLVVVNSVRTQVFAPSCFTDLGVDLRECRALVVKSSQHFRTQFEPHARAILYCDTPAALPSDARHIPYTRAIPRPIWPLDEVTAP